jgi:hypothetical protein
MVRRVDLAAFIFFALVLFWGVVIVAIVCLPQARLTFRRSVRLTLFSTERIAT